MHTHEQIHTALVAGRERVEWLCRRIKLADYAAHSHRLHAQGHAFILAHTTDSLCLAIGIQRGSFKFSTAGQSADAYYLLLGFKIATALLLSAYNARVVSDVPAWARPESRGFGPALGAWAFQNSQARLPPPGPARPRPGFGLGRGFS
ncbi:hypothetical protein K438DRAFT_1787919 [Mycena galopus ATCC 62051]|nr:hypothetical protein K438DRAFT_1787919 [Mycena galopus ATCC 62051]